MLHAAIRLTHTGIDPYPPADHRYGWLYSPLILLPLIGMTIWKSTANDFLSQVGTWRIAYLVWLVLMNLVSTALFFKLRRFQLTPRSNDFLLHLAISIVVVTTISVLYGTVAIDTNWERPLRLLAILSPLVAAVLFIWHSMRGHLLPVVIERAFFYAVGLIAILLVHRLLITPVMAWLYVKTSIDFFFVEGILIAAVILCVPALRMRVAESLRLLFSTNVVQVRNAIRQLALKLSQNASRDTAELTTWFAVELRKSIELEYVTILLEDDSGKLESTMTRSIDGVSASVTVPATDDWLAIHQSLSQDQRVLELGAIADPKVEQAFANVNALLAYRMNYRSVAGCVVLGKRVRNDRLGREQVYVLSIVIDQFAATLHNRREEMLRQRAERKILQQEKLSVLGLLSGSLAHELRNPLSSIRTITTLVIEGLDEHMEAKQELQMVIEEIDRLSQTANRLLDYSRPEPQNQSIIYPHRVVSRIVCVLDYLAKQKGVTTELNLVSSEIRLPATESALSEIVFNLVKNAIEAASDTQHGRVQVATRCEANDWVLTVSDNGNGIPEERQSTLFQPFATSKVDGNGLGLYAVNERVRELGGQVAFKPRQPQGTEFEVRLAMARDDDHSCS